MSTQGRVQPVMVAALVVIVGCATDPDPRSATATQPSGSPQLENPRSHLGISYELTEIAHDGNFLVTGEKKEKVDANSTLVLRFDRPEEIDPVSQEWLVLNRVLDQVEALAERRARLNAMPDPTSAQSLSDLRAKLEQYDADFRSFLIPAGGGGFLDMLKEFGYQDAQIRDILTGSFDGNLNPQAAFKNIARWLTKEVEKRHEEASDFVKNREHVMVTVHAFLDPVLGTRKALHIPGYDRLPEGQLAPIDRFGLRLTPAEQSRLKMEIEQAEVAAQSIREIQKHGGEVSQALREVLNNLRSRIDQLLADLSNADSWSSRLAVLLAPLRSLANNQSLQQTTRDAASGLVQELEGFKTDLQPIVGIVTEVRNLKQILDGAGTTGLTEVLFRQNGLLDTVAAFQGRISTLVTTSGTALSQWPQRFASIGRHVTTLGSQLPSEWAQIFPEETEVVLRSLSELPATMQFINFTVSFFSGGRVAEASEELSNLDAQPIPHGIENLSDAEVELARSGVTVGDQVTVKVSFHEKQEDGTLGDVQHEDRYRVETTLTGLHRIISAQVIFARAVTGDSDAEEWKPNVAAVAAWHYRIRDPEGFCTKTFNWFNPGLGVHVASVDQGSDTVEIGVGGNVSLWDGLVTGGYGYNLAEDDDYVFIGIGLLELFNEIRNRVQN